MSEQNPSGGVRAMTERPEEFPWPGRSAPGTPPPGRRPYPWGPPSPGAPGLDPVPPTRVWLDPQAGSQDMLYERLLERRIVLASGILDDPAATRLSAQLLTLDAEGGGPVRLELQNLQAELPAVLTLTGVLDAMRAEVQAFASGGTAGPALGVLASCPRRFAYQNASFTLSEPRLRFGGTVTAVTAQEQQANRMTDALYYRIAEATGQNAEDVRDDARRCRILTVAEAIGYGLIHERAARRPA